MTQLRSVTCVGITQSYLPLLPIDTSEHTSP